MKTRHQATTRDSACAGTDAGPGFRLSSSLAGNYSTTARAKAIALSAVSLLAFVTGAVAADGEYRLPDHLVRPPRNLLLEPARESAALDPARLDLSRADLAVLQPATASDGLKMAPAIHTETRGRKYKQFHSFRGQIYPYPDVVLDGIWQREAREVLYVYPGAAIDRIEIMRSASVLFSGLSDVVGVINLLPRRPLPGAAPSARAGVEGGSLGTWRAHGLHESSTGESSALGLGGQYFRTGGRTGRNAEEEFASIFGSWLFDPAPGHRLELGGWLLRGYRELETPDPDGPATGALKNRREIYDPITYSHVNLRGFHQPVDGVSTDWRVFVSDRRARYTREKIDAGGPGPGDTVADEDDREYGAQLIQTRDLPAVGLLRLGLFLHRWTAPDGKQSYVGSRQDVSSLAVVVAGERSIGDWLLDAGLRYSRSYLHDFSGPGFDIGGTSTEARQVADQWDDHVLTGTLGSTLALGSRSRVYAHAGAGERRPGPGAVREDGTSPENERRYTADAGWTMDWGAGGDGMVSLAGFGVWRRGAIFRINRTGTDRAGNEFYFSDNHDARQTGVELEGRTPGILDRRLHLFGGLTWMRSEVDGNGSGYARLPEIPSLVVTVGARAAAGPWDGSLLVKHVDRYENFRFAGDGLYHPLGDYWDVSLIGGFRFGRRDESRIYAAVDNLLDDAYSTVVGWSDPGRRYRLGLETAF